jgi:RecA-family ATPase
MAYCHGTGERWGAIDLYTRGAKCSKAEAIGLLAKEHGISSGNGNGNGTGSLQEGKGTNPRQGKPRNYAKEFEQALKIPLSPAALAWFERHGLPSILPELQKDRLIAFKPANKTYGAALVAPVTDLDRKILGLQYIPLDGGEKKFASGAEPGTYKKAFFTLYRGNGPVVLTEGVKDCLAVGVAIPNANVVSILSAGFVEKVHQFSNDEEAPILAFDNDEKGREATVKAGKILKGRCKVLDWSQAPEECGDPGDLLAKGHADLLRQMVREAKRWEAPETGDDLSSEGIGKADESTELEPSSFFASIALDDYRSGRFLESEPPPLKWLLSESILLGVLGLLVSNGGIGKSFFLLQLGVSIASMIPFLDGLFTVAEHGKVLLVFGEDTENVIHHRLHGIIRSLADFESIPAIARALNENLFIVSASGQDTRLIRNVGGNYEPSQVYDDLLTLAKSIEGLKLVVLDPISRFFSGQENDSIAATYFCSLLERIANETGATVLVSQHTNKVAGRGRAALVQESIRGSSGFTNAARWQMNLAKLDESEAKALAVNEDDLQRVLIGQVSKKNVGAPENAFFLRRDNYGILRKVELSKNQDDSDELVLGAVVQKLAELDALGVHHTKRTFCRAFNKVWRDYSTRKLDEVLNTAVSRGLLYLVERKTGKGIKAQFLHLEPDPDEESEERSCPL